MSVSLRPERFSRFLVAMACFLMLGASAAQAELISSEEGYLSSLCGYVYADINNNGWRETKEWRIPGVTITLKGIEDETGGEIMRTALTDNYGMYLFDSLTAGTYSLLEKGPEKYVDGKDTLNGVLSPYNDEFRAIAVGTNTHLGDYNFGEWGVKPKYLSKRIFIVPEPATSLLMAIGGMLLCGLAARRRR